MHLTESRCLRMAVAGLAAVLMPAVAFAAGPDPDRHIVKFRDAARGKSALKAAGGQVLLDLGPQRAAAARIPAHALASLRKNPNIEYIEQDEVRTPFSQTTPYGIPMVQADLLSDANAASRKVCIIDSGYYRNHEDLDADGSITGTNNAGSGNWYEDSCGHGTHVAGTVAALNNTSGVVGVNGSGNLKLHIIKVFDGADCGWAYSSSLVSALNACMAAGANVVSMSLGGGRSNRTEQSAFDSAYNNGVLSIAAAGNDGTTTKSYPASYASVVSVAAIDANKVVADFSQKNDAVEIAAPGVGVLSTVPWLGASVTVGGTKYMASAISNSASTSGVTGALVDGGICDTAGSWSGKVVLCARGTIGFKAKLDNVKAGGGLAGAIYNNVAGGFAGTCDDGTGTSCTIPGISLSQEDGQHLVAGSLGASGTVVSSTGAGSGYEAWDGTSMATPHVSGVAALVWSQNTSWTNAQIRDALQKSAEDLGAAGKDNSYGYGLVQAKAALDYLQGSGGGGGGGGGGSCTLLPLGSSCNSNSDCCSNACKGKPGNKTCK